MRTKNISSVQAMLKDLRNLSARIGSDPLLVQASTGNTSIKVDDVLWIKASGKWLVRAEADDFFIPVKLVRAKRCLRENVSIPETEAKLTGGPCASIETAMHAALPSKVVVHVHSVNTLAWALREDGPEQLRLRLSGLRWKWIPYTPSGNPLANNIDRSLSSSPGTNVLVLGNHGLVVGGDTCQAAEDLLSEVEHRLAVEPRPAPAAHPALLEKAPAGSTWMLPRCSGVHALATDRVSRRILSGGVLYPCQAIFLPGTAPTFQSAPPRQSVWGERERLHQQKPLLIEDHGVLCNKELTRAEEEVLVGLANVVQRIDACTPLRYLTASEVSGVLNGGSENYRRISDISCDSNTMRGGRLGRKLSVFVGIGRSFYSGAPR